jgi:hypothetical protein
MKRRVLLFLLVLVIAIFGISASAVASPPTTYATSQGFTATLNAASAGTYQISLMGNSLDFTMSGADAYQTLGSQSPLSIYNSGTAPFDVYVSADSAPSYMGYYYLGFSDMPGQDQVRWALSPYSSPGMGDTSVTDMYASGFGPLSPYNSMTLYSFLYTGSGVSYPGQYGWSGTVYAVPNS